MSDGGPGTDAPIALVALTEGGAALARRLRGSLGDAELHGREGRIAGDDLDATFAETTAHLRALFEAGRPIVAFCAAGIVIRALAPVLGDKRTEPPVVALSEDGASAVPLLGGHRGANDLARRIAAALGGHAALTTAGDVALGVGLDDPPPGWTVVNPEAAKAITAALLAGTPVALDRRAGPADWPPLPPHLVRASGDGDAASRDRPTAQSPPGLPAAPQENNITQNAEYIIRISDERTAVHTAPVPAGTPDTATLILHPPTLALGVGCERLADADGLVAFVRETLAACGLAEASVAAIGTVDLKADEPAMAALAQGLDRPLRLFDAGTLEAETPRLANPSETVFREIGCHGVAEAAALALAGADAALAVAKVKRGPYTLAVARAAPGRVVDAAAGRARGRLFVVGLGPGAAAWRTGECARALRAADAVVGYRLYLDLAADLIAGKPTFESDLGAEEARAAKALALAAEGRDVALVCSGDPGIYALATLVFELLAESEDRATRAVEVTVAPGVSAFQAAAARLGAPMGHDFCLISLSDLLTPRDAILRRLKAAADGDFVIAFYNPQSKRRRTLLGEARRILLDARPAATPVAICRSLGRPEENIEVTTLEAFDPETVDMLTLVIVGSSESRAFTQGGRPRLFTPRGYAGKRAGGPVNADDFQRGERGEGAEIAEGTECD